MGVFNFFIKIYTPNKFNLYGHDNLKNFVLLMIVFSSIKVYFKKNRTLPNFRLKIQKIELALLE